MSTWRAGATLAAHGLGGRPIGVSNARCSSSQARSHSCVTWLRSAALRDVPEFRVDAKGFAELTEESARSQASGVPRPGADLRTWWAVRVSNPRPRQCECRALPLS